ncbi:exodeoxyribonuclease V subunit gamma [Comamonas faecalis]|uniref:RecBCD enzyme subunit RecC n=1 Tax=Comamonas faecalis TaxID=1387849 RepID=A0ABP7R440_9BURK
MIPDCPPGLIALHSNRTDALADTMAAWLAAHPLAPLESEVVLVQSNGMAEWLKMQLAQHQGVCAAVRLELPARFAWASYRQVLGPRAVPHHSALDKSALLWRLMQLLPQVVGQPVYAPLQRYLQGDEPERRLQLARRLADLFDQYQIYRGDWLDAWAQGLAVLTQPGQPDAPLPAQQQWQCALWQALLAELSPAERAGTRAAVHARALQHLASGTPAQQPVARRVVVFGLSHMPLSLLQLLAALAGHSQIVLAVHNPSRYHWADAIDGRDLLRQQRQRHPDRGGAPLAGVPLQAMHLHAHPLLSAWGRQCRDTIRQLDAFDTTLQTAAELDWPRVDLYDDTPASDGLLLEQVQRSIRDLLPLAEHPRSLLPGHHVPAGDRSIVFHSAHSLVRELEVLHDQLLDLLAAPPAAGQAPLQPRDIVVMLPDVQQAAASIRAVFGQYPRQDARHIPFDIADLGARAASPLVAALQWLLRLPSQRVHLSELCDLLQVPAVAARLGLDEADLPLLTRWMSGAGIRWGLGSAQRAQLDLAACGDANSAGFGLRRMLLGYASGGEGVADARGQQQSPAWQGIEPYDEVGGLDAELAGALATLLDMLQRWWQQSLQPATPQQWADRLRALLAQLVLARSETDRALLGLLGDALFRWLQDCEQAGFDEPIALAVAQSAWLDALAQPSLAQRFRAGGVTFCTLMPMRAIPFEVVCLVGMNEGDYPRRSQRSDFDLMQERGQYRPGDRARRDDDRQLMLDALLSARRTLYVSWTGRLARDNSEQPPSVLVAQLRDYLAAGWRGQGDTPDSLLAERTTAHPLQPFSRAYFEQGGGLHTHAQEWRAAHAQTGDADLAQTTPVDALPAFAPDPQTPLTLRRLQAWLRHPARAFFQHRLQVFLDAQDETQEDNEPFALQGLDNFEVVQELQQQVCSDWLAASAQDGQPPGEDFTTASLRQHLQRLQRSGRLPLASVGQRQAAQLQATLAPALTHWQQARSSHSQPGERQLLHYEAAGVRLQDWLPTLLHAPQNPAAAPLWLDMDPRELSEKDGKNQRARADRLLPYYLRSLVAAACGQTAGALVVGLSQCLHIAPMPAAAARNALDALLALWRHGQSQPLPLPLRTALALLTQGEAKAVAAYQGSFQGVAEGGDPYWARLYPDYAALAHDGQLHDTAPQVHGPLLRWCQEQVRVQLWDDAN